jgi:hypothetical protein
VGIAINVRANAPSRTETDKAKGFYPMSNDNNTNTTLEAPIDSVITDPDPKIDSDALLADPLEQQTETSALTLDHSIEQPSATTDKLSETQLVEYKRELRVLNRSRKKHAKEATVETLRMGRILIKVKKIVGHGYFMQWISDNCEFTHETARLAMRLAEGVDAGKLKLQTIWNLGLKGAEKILKEQADESERPGRHGSSKSLKQGDDKITISKGAGWPKPEDGQVLEVEWPLEPAPQGDTLSYPFQQVAYVWGRKELMRGIKMRYELRYEHIFIRWRGRGSGSVIGIDYDASQDSMSTWNEIIEKLNRWSQTDPEKMQVLDHDPATQTMLTRMKALVPVVEQLAEKKQKARHARSQALKERFAQVKAEREEKEKLQQTTLITGKFTYKDRPEEQWEARENQEEDGIGNTDLDPAPDPA